MRVLVLLLALPSIGAFSSGGALPGSDSQGQPWEQYCDAIYTCVYGPDGTKCPEGMHKVAPPERTATYTIRSGNEEDPSTDPTTYVPGELLTITIRVTKRSSQSERSRGNSQ